MKEDQDPVSETSDTDADGMPANSPDDVPDSAADGTPDSDSDGSAEAVPAARVPTPLCERSHRVHWFTGRLGQVLDDVVGADGQAGLALSMLGVEETAETLIELDKEIARLEGLKASVLAHADALNVAAEVTPVSLTTGGWYAAATKTTRPAANKLVKQALRLSGERAATGAALRAGDIDAARATVVIDAVDALPQEVGPVLLADAEAHMLELAREFDADALKQLAKHLHAVIDPDGAEEALARRLEAEEEAAYAATRITIRDNGKGRTRTIIDSPTMHGGIFAKALDAHVNPRRPCHRNNDADSPDSTDVDEPPARNGDHLADPTDAGRRITLAEARGRAFLEWMENLDPTTLPNSGGTAFEIGVAMDLESLMGSNKPAMLDTGQLISAGETRRLAARHGIIPVVMGTKSEVLDVGQKTRLHTKAMRTALRMQHRTCTADGCTIPAAWCHAHHKIFWEHLGPTSLENGTLVCGRHHRMIHSRHYRTSYGPDGTTYITRNRR